MSLGKETAFRIFEVIDRTPKINNDDESKKKANGLKGNIEFQDV